MEPRLRTLVACGVALFVLGGAIGVLAGRSTDRVSISVERVTDWRTTTRTATLERAVDPSVGPNLHSVGIDDAAKFGADYCLRHGKAMTENLVGYSAVEIAAEQLGALYGIDEAAAAAIAEACYQVLPDPGG